MADQPFGSSAVWNSWDVPQLRPFGSTDSIAHQFSLPLSQSQPAPPLPQPAMSRPQSTTSTVPGFQPRIVSGTLPREGASWGPPSRSPSRMRRLSTSLLAPLSPPHHPEIVSTAPMQRPAYLDQSALRRFLQPDQRPPEPSIESTGRSSSAALSFTSDSEDDFGVREARGTPTPEPRLDTAQGIGFSTSKVQLSRLPGWEPFSWGYHGDDGNSFAGQSEGTPYGPVFGTGDVIGCGVDFTEGRAFYTKNGEFLKKVFRDLRGELYPSVGLRTPKERVLANFGQQPFRFDITTYVMQQRDRVWRDIQRTPLDALKNPMRIVRARAEALVSDSTEREADVLRRPLRALVLSYLTHHGYSSTARALRSATIASPTNLGDDTAMDEERQVEHELTLDEDDTAARQRIVRAVSIGDIDSALAEIESRYPKFVAADRDEHDEEEGMDADGGGGGDDASSLGMVMFRLRCRKLVEMVLAAEGDDLDGEASPDTPTRHSLALKGKGKGKGKASRDSMDLDGDIDMSPTELTPVRGLAAALEYGQFLHQKYGKDRRPGIAAELRAAAGL
ncbi:hypothetical protein FRC09_012660, partial [Ceratobasidium sp. 395]